MTPTLAEILRGNFAALAAPPTEGAAGDYLASRIGVVALLNLLAAQEVERGELAVVAENAAIELLLGDAVAAAYPGDVAPPAVASSSGERDRRNAVLRRALVEVHEAAERAGDRAFDGRILKLYQQMALGRQLELPPMPTAEPA